MNKILVQYNAKIVGKKHKGLIWVDPAHVDQLQSLVLKWLIDTQYTAQTLGTLSRYQIKHDTKVDAWVVPTM